MTELALGQKALCPLGERPPDHRVGLPNRALERLRQGVSADILCARILGANLVAGERSKEETWKLVLLGKDGGRSYRSRCRSYECSE